MLGRHRPGGFVRAVGGGLGWGIGAAVGHRLGAPERPAVAVLGDGCAMFGLQGLWSAAHHRVPVLFVAMANGEYHTLKDTFDARGGSPSVACPGLDLGELDWRPAARFFGIPAVRVDDAEELAQTVAAVRGLDGPLLAEVASQGHAGAPRVRP
ncbi:thiamine pyrophosphate-dependent enzyme [Actinacidiphila sp. bgisy160]|uniref:thiamine pyrophosphate-dependent enzyme n=1 Tax=Actinacidiphila sp. bgisy160 TaxID=3413796 RepID=UPI003D74ECCD